MLALRSFSYETIKKKFDNLSFAITDVNTLKAGKWIRNTYFCQNILLKPYYNHEK